MNRRSSPNRGFRGIVIAFALLALFLGVLVFRKFEDARTPPPVPVAPYTSGLVSVTLFFGAESGDGLVREGREMEPCDDLPECLEGILQELINGPVGDLAPVLPLTGMFYSVRVEGGTAVIDFARELTEGLPGGSSSELYAVYAVVNSICFNYPQVASVQLTVEGKRVNTLKGHVDISRPITPDYTLEKSAVDTRSGKGKRL